MPNRNWLAILGVAGVVLSCGATASPASPWDGPDANGSLMIAAQQTIDGKPSTLSLRCSAKSGFSAVYVVSDPMFHSRIDAVAIKASSGASSKLVVDQDESMPAITRLKGLDSIERDLLSSDDLTLRITTTGSDDKIATFHFDGLSATKTAILKICPPF